MPSDFPNGALPVLIVDANVGAAHALVAELRPLGVDADITLDCTGAQRALRRMHYRSLVLAADVLEEKELLCLTRLRRAAPTSWIIVIARQRSLESRHALLGHWGADSVLTWPLVIEDLIYCLSAFSHRPRPA